jgi:hypothetical protein
MQELLQELLQALSLALLRASKPTSAGCVGVHIPLFHPRNSDWPTPADWAAVFSAVLL